MLSKEQHKNQRKDVFIKERKNISGDLLKVLDKLVYLEYRTGYADAIRDLVEKHNKDASWKKL